MTRSSGRSRSLLACLLLLVPALVALPAWGADDEPAGPDNVLLITVDTLRPDALGWVAGKNSTPRIDALAAGGCAFAGAVSPAPITLPAHASIMTALIPRRHGVRDNGQLLGERMPTLAGALSDAGYSTAAFVSAYPLAAEFGLDRGFSVYDGPSTSSAALERPAEETTAAAARWLATAREPWFLWVHYYDPHAPYEPPAELVRPGERGAYDGEVARVDAAVGELLAAADRASDRPRLTLLTADHGESLGEHGEQTHGFFIYDSTVLVPMIVHRPGVIKPCESEFNPRLIDVAPTIFDLLGLPPWNGVDGTSFTSSLFYQRWQLSPPAYVESWRPYLSYGWAPYKGMRFRGWKLIATPIVELYDLGRDPGETNNRVDEPNSPSRRLAAAMREIENQPVLASATPSLDPETAARLRALGYTGGGGARAEPPAGLPDPKRHLDAWNRLGEAEELLAAGRPAEALERFDAVLAQEPANPFALARSGVALLELERPGDAAERLEKAAQVAPSRAEIRFQLAQALTLAGRHDDAAAAWREVIALQPRRADAWSRLGTALGLAGRRDDAVGAFERAAALDPGSSELAIRLGFALHGAGRSAQAAKTLLAAAALSGEESFPHPAALGLLLAASERAAEALPWLRRSTAAEPEHARARLELARLELAAGDEPAARTALAEACAADPALRAEAAKDPALAPLLP